MASASDEELLARFGLKRASQLQTPEEDAVSLPWVRPDQDGEDPEPAGISGLQPSLRDLTARNRAVADAEAEETRLAGGPRRRRAPRAHPTPKPGRRGKDAKGERAPASGASGTGADSKLIGGRPAVPEWGDAGAAPDWATDGDLPDRVAALIADWDRHEAGGGDSDQADAADREAAERIAAGDDVGPKDADAEPAPVPLNDEEALHLARAVGLRLLNAQPRTKHELSVKMAERDVPAAAIVRALDEFERYRYLDDAAFARAWVESRTRSKGFARGRLAQELRRKGVDAELIEAALEQIDADEERQRCEQLALKKLGHRTLPPLGPSQEDRKERDKVLRRVVGFLARKGFNQSMALGCAKRAMQRHDDGER